jgi:hypothetical protein
VGRGEEQGGCDFPRAERGAGQLFCDISQWVQTHAKERIAVQWDSAQVRELD